MLSSNIRRRQGEPALEQMNRLQSLCYPRLLETLLDQLSSGRVLSSHSLGQTSCPQFEVTHRLGYCTPDSPLLMKAQM